MTTQELKQIRADWQMTPAQFAALLSAPVRTYEGWEQGRPIPATVAAHIATIGNLKAIYAHWDRIAQAIVRAGGAPLTGDGMITAINRADDLADKHEKLWGKLFPSLRMNNRDARRD